MPAVSVLLKPVSAACNMGCRYCFYRDEASHGSAVRPGLMPPEVLGRTIASALAYARGSCSFLFQGGEPTLAGLGFYRRALELEEKYAPPGVTVQNAIQTNGLLLDEAWAAFLAESRFLIGLSLDGPAELHDRNRPDAAGRGTCDRVLRAAALLDRYGADYSILCVVTGQAARRGESVYRFFRERGFSRLQFIPCLEPLDGTAAGEWRLSPEDYGGFLIRTFDLWYKELLAGEYVSVRHLDNWLGILLGLPPECCGMTGRCSVQFTVESGGDVYPCDFYVLDEWRLGRVGEASFAAMGSGERERRFLAASHRVPGACRACRYYPLCRNGCRRDREGDITRLCPAYREFFTRREEQLLHAARLLAPRVRR